MRMVGNPSLGGELFVSVAVLAWAAFAVVSFLFWTGIVVALWMFILGKLPFQRQKLCSRCHAELDAVDPSDAQLRALGKALKERASEAAP